MVILLCLGYSGMIPMHREEICRLTLCDSANALRRGELTSRELVDALRAAWLEDATHEKPINGYVEFFEDAEKQAEDADLRRSGGNAFPLLGLPVAVKDNIQVQGRSATCASKILKNYVAPYSATVTSRLADSGVIFLGRANMDEFAMGSSCEYSCYGATRNPSDRDRTAGGSSGGSAAVVAGMQAPFALGSDTGGSVRLPASFCGVYGLKPSYGTLSRYGLVAFGSSLDQIGFLSRAPDDLALVLKATAGADPKDDTSTDLDVSTFYPLSAHRVDGLRIAIPAELVSDVIHPEVMSVFGRFRDWLESAGAQITVVPMPALESSVALYYIIAPAEASSNLSRFDGVKYGARSAGASNLQQMYRRTREEGFGPEVKRRILIGNYVLSSGYYDAYYKKAQAVRFLLKRQLDEVFVKYDLLLSPTSPSLPFKLGEKLDDPLSMYLTDICTTVANLTGTPSISIPAGRSSDQLPVGVQLTGRMASEELLLQVAKTWHLQRAEI